SFEVSNFVRISSSRRVKYPFKPEFLIDLNKLPNSINHHKKDYLELSDVFVWPRLEKSSITEDVSYRELDSKSYLEILSKNGCFWIFGGQYSGKSCLAKSLVSSFNLSGRFVILLDFDSLSLR